MPKVISVIESHESRGKGTPEDPCRWVDQYFTLEGKLLSENDPCEHHNCNQKAPSRKT